jgi:hypothetical protein
MALNPQFSTVAVNAQADAIGNALNTGYIRIYDGAQPENADVAVTDQVLLAELRFGADAFPLAVEGAILSNAITADASANASGTASWCRILASNGTTVWFDGTVGTDNANLILASTDIVAGANIAAPNGLLVTVPKAGEVIADDIVEP